MKAALIDRYGSNDAVSVADIDIPTLGATDLLVRVHAASVNPVYIKTRDGKLKTLLKYRFPLVLGNDLSGVVSDVGSRVTRFKKGDAVYARVDKNRIGTFAEFAAVRDGAAALKPTNVTFEEAASLPLVALTAWQALVEIGRLGADQRVLIHAGSGGVGSVAIQLARHMGATVFTTVGARNVELVKRLGANVAIDYRSERFEDVAKDCDVVLDSAGGDTLVRCFECVKPDGVVVSINSSTPIGPCPTMRTFSQGSSATFRIAFKQVFTGSTKLACSKVIPAGIRTIPPLTIQSRTRTYSAKPPPLGSNPAVTPTFL